MRHAFKLIMAAATLSSAATAQTGAAPAPAPPVPQGIAAQIDRDISDLMTLYRDLHAHPELSEQETATAAKLARRLKAMKFDVTEKVGGTGVVAVMKNGEGPVLLIRASWKAMACVGWGKRV